MMFAMFACDATLRLLARPPSTAYCGSTPSQGTLRSPALTVSLAVLVALRYRSTTCATLRYIVYSKKQAQAARRPIKFLVAWLLAEAAVVLLPSVA